MKNTANNDAVNLKVGDYVAYCTYINGRIENVCKDYVVREQSKKDGLRVNSSFFLRINKLRLFQLSNTIGNNTVKVIEIIRRPSLLDRIKNLLSFKR